MLETKPYWWALTYMVKHYETFLKKIFGSVPKKKVSYAGLDLHESE